MLVQHDDVAATSGSEQQPFVVLPALVTVHRLDEEDGAFAVGEGPPERFDDAIGVLALGDAEVVEGGDEDVAIVGQPER